MIIWYAHAYVISRSIWNGNMCNIYDVAIHANDLPIVVNKKISVIENNSSLTLEIKLFWSFFVTPQNNCPTFEISWAARVTNRNLRRIKTVRHETCHFYSFYLFYCIHFYLQLSYIRLKMADNAIGGRAAAPLNIYIFPYILYILYIRS